MIGEQEEVGLWSADMDWAVNTPSAPCSFSSSPVLTTILELTGLPSPSLGPRFETFKQPGYFFPKEAVHPLEADC